MPRPNVPSIVEGDPKALLAMVALIGVSLIIYAQVLLPFKEVLACGTTYGADYQMWLGTDGLPETADDVGTEPACISPMPRLVQGLLPFWPFLALSPFAFVVFRFVGSPHSGITLLLTLAVVNAEYPAPTTRALAWTRACSSA